MKLIMSFSDGKWGGWLLNDYDPEHELYKNYSFRMDARTGKIWWLTGGLQNVVYTKKDTITNEQVVESIRKLIKKFQLANVSRVDWSTVQVHNAGTELSQYSVSAANGRITHYVEFYNDEGEYMRIDIDYETGELWQILNKSYMYLYE